MSTREEDVEGERLGVLCTELGGPCSVRRVRSIAVSDPLEGLSVVRGVRD